MSKIFKIALTLLITICLSACEKSSDLLIHVISDVHYAPRDLYEYVGTFAESNDANGTGKQIKYQEEIIDAFIKQEIANKPDYLLVTGDMAFSGSKEVHQAFKDKFNTLLENGIKVLVIPGNHDFDLTPFTYPDGSIHYVNQLTKEEYLTIYDEFGYKDADSVDKESLSYAYKLDNKTYLIALDTLTMYGYTPGSFKQSTLDWIEERMEYAHSHNLDILVAGHHNMYVHNEVFDFGYRIDNAQDLIGLFNKYNAHLYLSGHMHIQDIGDYSSIKEILTESFTLYPHRYGELKIVNHQYTYEAKASDIEKYTTSTNSDLLNYKEYGQDFLFNNFYNQLADRYEKEILEDESLKEIVNILTLMNENYFMGEEVEEKYLAAIKNYPHQEYLSGYIKSFVKYLNKGVLKTNGSLK